MRWWADSVKFRSNTVLFLLRNLMDQSLSENVGVTAVLPVAIVYTIGLYNPVQVSIFDVSYLE